jgi:hypothetical protein
MDIVVYTILHNIDSKLFLSLFLFYFDFDDFDDDGEVDSFDVLLVDFGLDVRLTLFFASDLGDGVR